MAAAAVVASCRGQPPARPRELSLHTDIRSYTLKNGLQVVLMREPGAQVEIAMRYRVGAVDDPPGKAGMAHLVEHLMFAQRPGPLSLAGMLDQTALAWTASTGLDATDFLTRAPVDRLGDVLLAEALRLALRCATIDDEAFERERAIALDEQRQRGPAAAVQAAIAGALYPADHPYHRAVGGDPAALASITRAEACAFVDRHYTPDNALLVVIGDVAPATLEAALVRGLAFAPRRATAPAPPVTAFAGGRRVDVQVPADRSAVVAAWPLPPSPVDRVAARTVARMALDRIGMEVEAARAARSVRMVELGGDRAPVLAIWLELAGKDSPEAALAALKRGIAGLPAWFGERHFESVRWRAMRRLFEDLETPWQRAVRLADLRQHGSPRDLFFVGEAEVIDRLDRDRARGVARAFLALPQASLLVLRGARAPGAAPLVPSAPVHGDEAHRGPVDPADAHRPAPAPPPSPGLTGAQVRTLGNGLRVVLVPAGQLPLVDVRLIFPAGRAAEPAGQFGAAVAAADVLRIARDDLGLDSQLYDTGSSVAGFADDDATVFWVHGLDVHLDLLLSGLERTVLAGTYDDLEVDEWAEALQRRADRPDVRAAEARSSALSTALHGADHPYTRDLAWSRAELHQVGDDDLYDFKERHYRPGGATLIVSGRFDPAETMASIERLFGDWSGRAARGDAPAVTGGGGADLAFASDDALVAITLAYPTAGGVGGDHAARLVLAEMLTLAARDVPPELAAAYAVRGQHPVRRAAGALELVGEVDPARAGDALQLLRDRVAAIRAGGDDAARWFVRARRAVLEQLTDAERRSGPLAAMLEEAAVDGAEPAALAGLPAAVAALTVESVQAVAVRELDEARQVWLLVGPREAVSAAFAAVGATPRWIEP